MTAGRVDTLDDLFGSDDVVVSKITSRLMACAARLSFAFDVVNTTSATGEPGSNMVPLMYRPLPQRQGSNCR
jgi:hypothetical protein